MDRFKNIVAGIDISGREHLIGSRRLSRFSEAALEKAHWVAQRNGATLHVLTTLDVDPLAEDMIRRAAGAGQRTVFDDAKNRLEELVDPLRGDGVEVTTSVHFGRPSRALAADAIENGRDLVVVGTRERGALARRFLGSTALWLLRNSPCPVWVARVGPHHDFRDVLVPVDFGPLAAELVSIGRAFAEDVSADLHVLHVIDDAALDILRSSDADEEMIQEYRTERRAHAEQQFDALVEGSLSDANGVVQHLRLGEPAEEILLTADELDADLVVMCTVTAGTISGLLMGSTAEKVLPRLETSLLVLKPEGLSSPVEE